MGFLAAVDKVAEICKKHIVPNKLVRLLILVLEEAETELETVINKALVLLKTFMLQIGIL